jgi:carboxymethylenebutenolidase
VTVSKLDVRTDDGVMDVYLHLPADHPAEGGAPLPTVIMYPDAFGVRPVTHAMAQRLADHGYAVALLNVLYRTPLDEPFDVRTAWADPEIRGKLTAVLSKATVTAVMKDTAALLAALDDVPAAKADKVGTTGYCMGGRLAISAAAAHPDRVAAAASFHGGRMAVDDDPESPHKNAGEIRAKLYFGVADQDRSCTSEDQARLAAALDEAKVDYTMEVYPGALHGYAVADFDVYDKAADERHWANTERLFDSVLKG